MPAGREGWAHEEAIVTDTRISLEEAASRLEILDLFARYCHAIDRYEFSLFDDVFTADVIADYSDVRDPEDDPIIHGRSEFAAWLEASMASIGPGMTHYMTNHLITMDGDEATIVSHDHVLNVAMGGVYHSRAVRTPEGWRLAEIRFEARYFAPVVDRLNASMAPSGVQV
jgi:SnoaL-like domain